MIEFKKVVKKYSDNIALVDFDLQIKQGEFVTLLGPSGSGKTTCLNVLSGFDKPTTGEVWVNGLLVNNVPAHKRNVGMVFQDYSLFPHMTVEENLAFPLKAKRIHDASSIKRMLEIIKMQGFEKRFPHELSGGQQQRVALARALISKPEIILMDEPLGALDSTLREELKLEIKKLHSKLGFTVLYVTHDQAEAFALSTCLVVLLNGRILQIGTPQEIYSNPKSAQVARIVGCNNELRHLPIKHKAVTVGKQMSFFVRPEDIRINPPRSMDNMFKAKVLDSYFLGDSKIVLVDLQGQEVKIKTKNDTILPQEITIGWDAIKCIGFNNE